MVPNGNFISFEGGEGVGKTTQVKLLKQSLINLGIKVVETREPGGSPSAELILELLVSGPVERWDPMSEAMLHFVSRRVHIKDIIKPALDRGDWVITDRFTDSTIAYQGFGQGVSSSQLTLMQDLAIGKFTPHITFILDLPADIGLARAASRKDEESRYEKMDLELHNRLREGFLSIAKKNPRRIKIIDASQPSENVAEHIWEELSGTFNLNNYQQVK